MKQHQRIRRASLSNRAGPGGWGLIIVQFFPVVGGYQFAQVGQNTPPSDTSDIHWVVLSVLRSDLDDRPLADKLFDAGMLVGYYLTAIRLSPHFSRVRLKENLVLQEPTY